MNFQSVSLRACDRRCARHGVRALSAVVIGIALAAPAIAHVYPVDDSATVVVSGPAKMRWRTNVPRGPEAHLVDARGTVQLVLNTGPWAGKPARIYMLLAPQPLRMQVQWNGRGVFLPGRLQPGQRTLVFEGPIPGPMMRDTLDLTVTANGREMASAQRLQFSYEIEVQP
jgi:hypothetical protein